MGQRTKDYAMQKVKKTRKRIGASTAAKDASELDRRLNNIQLQGVGTFHEMEAKIQL
jgi:hypothetical protein